MGKRGGGFGSIIGSVLGGLAGGPVGAAIGSGLGTVATGGTPQQALLGAAGGLAGGALLGGALGPAGTVASSLGSVGLGGVAQALPASLAGSSVSGLAGQALGQQLGQSLATEPERRASGVLPTAITGQQTAEPFNPQRPASMALPSSLSDLGGLSDIQQSTAIATKGVEGGGVGGEGQNYFLNLLQRRLVDQGGNLAGYEQVNPIEEQFLQQRMGFQFSPNTRSLLEAIARQPRAG